MDFNQWLDTFVQEKELDKDQEFFVEHNGNTHFIELGVVLMLCKKTNKEQQESIKKTIVKLDFYNADVTNFFEHLAKAYVHSKY